MKILIQDAASEQYLATDGTWTADVRAAKDFRLSLCAYAAARREHVQNNFQVLFYFEELDYSVKIGKRRGPAGAEVESQVRFGGFKASTAI